MGVVGDFQGGIGSPLEILFLSLNPAAPGPASVWIEIVEWTAQPDPNYVPRFKVLDFAGQGVVNQMEYSNFAGTIVGHSNAENAFAVGAYRSVAAPPFPAEDTYFVEPFSSRGGVPLLVNDDGSAKATAVYLPKPNIMGPDGSTNTFFGGDIDGSGQPNFFGTSAAAPNIAALAALVKQARYGQLSIAEANDYLVNNPVNLNTSAVAPPSGVIPVAMLNGISWPDTRTNNS